MAATVALSMAACPWIHGYDMPALAVAIVILFARAGPKSRPVLGWVWFWPGALTIISVPNALSFLSVASVAWLACRVPPLAGQTQR